MNTLAVIWMLATISDAGYIRQIGDYRSRAACEAAMLQGLAQGLALRCIQTSQLVPRAYFESLQ